MILVDTTVWIDFFKGRGTPEVRELERLVNNGEDICVCGVILTEVLQGIRENKDYAETASAFDAFVYLPMTQVTFRKAAEFYRDLRQKGITIRNSVDCMIAAVAVEHDIPLLHHDRDFAPIAKHCGLRLVVAGETPTSKPAAKPRKKNGKKCEHERRHHTI